MPRLDGAERRQPSALCHRLARPALDRQQAALQLGNDQRPADGEAGAELGPLKNANQGVIRITGDDGNDFDDGSSRMKRLRVVSTFEYELR